MDDQTSPWRQFWALRRILVIVLTPIILLPIPVMNTDEKSRCAYVILLMAVYWMTEAVPIEATSLIPFFLFPVLGLLTAKTVSATYMNDTSMLFFGGLLVAVAIETWNLHKRIALGVMLLVGDDPKWLMGGLMSVTWFLSIWLSNTATTGMMIPILQGVLQQLKTSGVKENSQSETGSGNSVEHDVALNPVMNTETRQDSMHMFELRNGETQQDIMHVGEIRNGETDARLQTATCRSRSQAEPDSSNNKREQEDPHYTRLSKALSLCICYSANVGGIASLTGTGPNVILKGQAEIIFTEHNATSPITYATWMMYGLPLSFVVLVILWIWLQVFFLRARGWCSQGRVATGEQLAARLRLSAMFRQQYKKLGPVSFAEWSIIVLFGLLVVLWITRDLGGVGGWVVLFKSKYVSDSTPALIVGFLLFVLPSRRPTILCCRRSNDVGKPTWSPILKWQDVQDKMPWCLYLILGAGYALARASNVSGLSAWLGNQLQVFSDLDPYVMLIILSYIVCFTTELTSNTATATLVLPIMAELAISLNMNPLFLMFPAAFVISFAFMLPVATPPNAIVFSYGQVRVIDMASCGFMLNIVCVPVTVLATATWGNAIFNLEVLPAGFLPTSRVHQVFNITV